MINCKIAVPELCACHSTKCCFYCEDKDTCPDACEDIAPECPEQVEEINELQVMQTSVPEALQMVTEISVLMEELEEQQKLMKQKLLEAMEQHGIKKFENEQVSFTYVAPTTRTSVDSTKLKKLHPDIFEECSKTSNVSASVRIKVK